MSNRDISTKTDLNDTFTFDEIEKVDVKVTIKGKDYALAPKPGREKNAEINRHVAVYMLLDEHIVAYPSIDDVFNSNDDDK